MYGLLLEGLCDFIKQVYGEDRWEEIRRLCNVEQPTFSVHQVYPENLLPKLAKKAIAVLGVEEREFFDMMGVYFVRFVGQYGYDKVLSVLGRHMRDFLNGLDNLHEYLKFSYPRMRAPSFICENETREGLTLHYRSKRRGFVYYTMGQIREVSRAFYHKELQIDLIKEEMVFDTLHVTFQLTFDNIAFGASTLILTHEEKHLPVNASVLLEIFPFCLVFGSDLIVQSIGKSLMQVLPDMVGKKVTNWFDLVRPLINFQFETILNRTNNIFELVTVEPVIPDKTSDDEGRMDGGLLDDMDADKNLHLKGQMVYMDNWKMIMYLGTPVMPDLTSLISTGLYINDLSMHDFSRDLMLAGTQQSVELKLALDQEQQKSKKLEDSMRKLDEEMRRTDELLYQMIPKQVADRLRKGENPIDTCEVFETVSVLFSDVVTFTEICSRITPMEVVSMLNAMYSIFDNLTERNRVYKVETIGDAYMVVGGAPEHDESHAERICDMALDMVDAITDLKDPSTGNHLQIRVGVHTGAVVAGIVGLKMPRYCLFGDSVNTASRMESTSTAMKIHVSELTKNRLPTAYKLSERGEIKVKGKGDMKTYWLESRDGRAPLTHNLNPAVAAAVAAISQATARAEEQRRGSNAGADADGGRNVTSPTTLQQMAQKSAANSPVKAPVRVALSPPKPAHQQRKSSTTVIHDPVALGDSIHLPGSPTTSPIHSPPIPVGVPLNKDLLSPQSAKKQHTSASQPKEEKASTSAVTTEWTQVWDNAGKRSKAKKSKSQKEQQIIVVENQENSTISISNSEGSLQEAVRSSRRQQVPNSTSDHHLVVNSCCQHAPVPVYCNQPQHHHHHCCAAYSGSKQRVTSNTCGLL